MNKKFFSDLLLRSLFTKKNSHFTQLARRNYSFWQRAAAMTATKANMFNGPNRMMMSTSNGGGAHTNNQEERVGININTGETVRQPA